MINTVRTFETTDSNTYRPSYNWITGIVGTVVSVRIVLPKEVQPHWYRGDWAHIIEVEDSDGWITTLGNGAENALDIQVYDDIVIGEIFLNETGLDFYSDKHTLKLTDQGFQTYDRHPKSI